MSSGAGEVVNRRRRVSALFTFSCFRCFLLRSIYQLSSQIHLSKLSRTFFQSMSVKGKLKSCDRERRWCLMTTLPIRFLNFIPSPTPSTYCDALSKDEILFIVTFTLSTRSGSAQSPLEESSHVEFIFRMALPWLSDRTSTAKLLCNGGREKCFIISLNQTSPYTFNREPTSNRADLTKAVTVPMSQTPEKDLAKPPSELPSIFSEHSTALMPIWSTCPPPLLRRRRLESFKTLIAMGSSLVLGPTYVQPLIFQHWPISRILGPTTLSIWPRYTILIMLSSPNGLTFLYLASMTRRHHPCLVLTSTPRSCDYQSLITLISAYRPPSFENLVDSKKILAQPHQSAMVNSSRQRADPESTPPVEEDWKKSQVDSEKILAQPHQSFKSLYFSFFPRSEISFADDLAKKAVRSMTTGLSMLL